MWLVADSAGNAGTGTDGRGVSRWGKEGDLHPRRGGDLPGRRPSATPAPDLGCHTGPDRRTMAPAAPGIRGMSNYQPPGDAAPAPGLRRYAGAYTCPAEGAGEVGDACSCRTPRGRAWARAGSGRDRDT